MRFYHYSSLIVRIVIGGLFVVAGLLKLFDLNAFAWTIFQYGLVPQGLIPIAAMVLPLIEVIAGTAFVLNARQSFLAMLVLLGLFMVVLAYGIMTGLAVECGCFPGEELTGGSSLRAALLRDLAMLAGVLYVYGYRRMQAKGASARAQTKE